MTSKQSTQRLKEDVVRSFHEQFAVNQNTQFTLLITVAVSLATVLGGLGYVIVKYCSNGKLAVEDNVLVYAAANCAATLYGYGVILLVSAMSFGFRRDQLILNDLRGELDMFKEKSRRKQYLAIFPPQYSGKTAFNAFPPFHLNWMPNHYAVITRLVALLLVIVNMQLLVFLRAAKLIFQWDQIFDLNLFLLAIWPPVFLLLGAVTPFYYRVWFDAHHRDRKPRTFLQRLILCTGKRLP